MTAKLKPKIYDITGLPKYVSTLFYTDYFPSAFAVSILNEIGVIANRKDPNGLFALYPVGMDADIFYTKEYRFHLWHEIGRDFLCDN